MILLSAAVTSTKTSADPYQYDPGDDLYHYEYLNSHRGDFVDGCFCESLSNDALIGACGFKVRIERVYFA